MSGVDKAESLSLFVAICPRQGSTRALMSQEAVYGGVREIYPRVFPTFIFNTQVSLTGTTTRLADTRHVSSDFLMWMRISIGL